MGISRGTMKCFDTCWNTEGEGAYLGKTDTSALKCGEQTGLETPVVHTLNDARSSLVNQIMEIGIGGIVKALNVPLGEYGRKTESQKN